MAKTRLYVLLGILLVLLGGFGFALAQVTGKPLVAIGAVALLLAGILLMVGVSVGAVAVAIAVHELGHYLAGRAVGFRFHNAVVGPYGFRREGAHTVPYRVRPARLYGYVAMVPEGDVDLARRYLGFVVGGPIASLLWTALVVGAWRVSGVPILLDMPPHASVGQFAFCIVATYVLLGTVLVLPGTLLPYRVKRMGGMPTDMLWIVMLCQRGEEARRLMATMTLFRLLSGGMAARDLPLTLLEEATRLRDGNLEEMTALSLRWGHALHHDPMAARWAIARHAEIYEALGAGLVEPWRGSARLVQALDAVYAGKDPGAGEAWLADVGQPSHPNLVASLAIVQAGLAALRDDPDRQARLASAEEAVDDAARRTTTDWTWERERISALRAGWPSET